jgi:sulfoxide reductase heme-binding subunit YedZ
MPRTVERRIEWIFTAACLAFAAWMVWQDHTARWISSRQTINIELGLWSTRLLLVGLMMTPVSQALRQPFWKRLRRPLGLAAAAFALLHAVQYLLYANVWPDHLLQLLRRPYLLVGVIALGLMLPLSLTSFNCAVRAMGPRRWRRLHWLVYPAAILTILHEVWSGARLVGEVGVHLALLVLLLAWRMIPRARKLAPMETRGLAADRV